jgi:hypothetical protein
LQGWDFSQGPVAGCTISPKLTVCTNRASDFGIRARRKFAGVDRTLEQFTRLALLPPDGPTGGFFETGGSHPW